MQFCFNFQLRHFWNRAMDARRWKKKRGLVIENGCFSFIGLRILMDQQTKCENRFIWWVNRNDSSWSLENYKGITCNSKYIVCSIKKNYVVWPSTIHIPILIIGYKCRKIMNVMNKSCFAWTYLYENMCCILSFRF